ncbi:MAG: hypothetical protein Q4A44_04225 [Bacteroidales bacterium]|nr:hypothetical protein [Bacteroidales bacterium]
MQKQIPTHDTLRQKCVYLRLAQTSLKPLAPPSPTLTRKEDAMPNQILFSPDERSSVLRLYGQLVRQGAKIQNEVLTRGQSYNYRYDFQYSIISK